MNIYNLIDLSDILRSIFQFNFPSERLKIFIRNFSSGVDGLVWFGLFGFMAYQPLYVI